jgi:hypothetical protein
MQALTASQLLAVWEQGTSRTPVQQALLLLAAALPGTSPAELAELSIGQRDKYLLALREQLFGSQLTSVVACPVCSEKLEFTCYAADLQAQASAEPGEPLVLHHGTYEVHFRLPNSLDLTAVAVQADPSDDELVAIRNQLLARCLITATHDNSAINVDQLPEIIVSNVIAHMAEADPQADVQLALSCAACSHQWQATFDITLFLWAEIDAWAVRTLHEVHHLAIAYGWSESDILSTSAWRRQYYLNLVQP